MSLRTNAKVTLTMEGAEFAPVPKEKMLTYQHEELSKQEKRLLHKHEQWKVLINEARQDLKNALSDEDLAALAGTLKQRQKDLVNDYDDIRSCVTPSPDLRHKMEASDGISEDLMTIIYARRAEANGHFGAQRESHAVHQLLNHNNPHSMYGAAPLPSVSQPRAESSLAEERMHKEKMEQQMKELEMQTFQCLQAERDLQAACATLEVYDRDVQQGMDGQPMQWNRPVLFNPPVHHRSSFPVTPFPVNITPLAPTDVRYLAKAIQDGVAKNGLLTSEPTLFSGDPNHFIEWKESFMSLVDQKDISGADKLNYLKKYVTGPAYKCLEGSFNRNDDDAYREAWEELNLNYGRQTAVGQRALRENLSIWPKILSKDSNEGAAQHSTIQTQMNGKPRPRRPCTLCKDSNHQLRNCSEFMKRSLDDRRMYVKDYGLCYGCLKPGHSVKECHHRHTCDLCKGRHPNCLHDKNYRKDGAKEGAASAANAAPGASKETREAAALSFNRAAESSGPAHKCLEGAFYQSDDKYYRDVWEKLNQHPDQAFFVQSALIEKLSKWPKIKSKDIEGLRAFADFLNACLQATPQVKGSEILSDSEENQLLLQKVPKWLESRWNRQVSEALMNGSDFPTFADFTQFVSKEAEMACNPVTSIHAVRPSDWAHEKRIAKEIKGKRATVFSGQTLAKSNNKQTQINGKLRPPRPCTLCKNNNHQLHNCSEFMKGSLDDRRVYVKDYWLCYGCLKPGHSAKQCRHRHTCDLCKGRHPTCLHDENYKKDAPKERSANAASTAANLKRVQESHSPQ